MATTKVLKGRLMRITVNGDKILYATNCSLTIAVEERETANKDNYGDWKTVEPGVKSWTGSAEAQYSFDPEVDVDGTPEARANAEAIFDLIEVGDLVDIEFLTGVEGDIKYSGKAMIANFQADFPNDGNATWSKSLTGSGKLTKSVIPAA